MVILTIIISVVALVVAAFIFKKIVIKNLPNRSYEIPLANSTNGLPIMVNGVEYYLPTTWRNITLAQYMAMELHAEELRGDNDSSLIRLLSIFTGIPIEELMNFDCSNLPSLQIHIDFLAEQIDFDSLEVPKVIILNKRVVNVPETIEPFGAKYFLEQKIDRSIKDNWQYSRLLHSCLAMVFAKELDKNKLFNEDSMKFAESEVAKMSILDAYPIANFFLKRYGKRMRAGVSRSNTFLRKKKLMQE